MPARAGKGRLEMTRLLAVLALAAPLACAAEEAVRLDAAPIDPRDVASLQAGARSFVNYCLNCHSAGMMRYHKLQDLGISEQQVKDNLLFTADKIGELMNVSMTRKDAKEWFGAAPPDLSVIARARGPDWLYTYMRSFYRDPESATGWNNMVFERVAMPHVLWTLSGQQVQVERKFRSREQAEAIGRQQKNAWKIDVLTPEQAGKDGERYVLRTIRTETAGSLSQLDYDVLVRDLVNFMTWMAEPNQVTRKQVGYIVLLVLLALLVLTYLLYKEFWKDVH
jgi:ubiquinol-cytochrome c reductase cytochrome c1 subunit